ncbi:MAG: zinc ribbon domain-containing protein [Chthoniobacterales bacterium]
MSTLKCQECGHENETQRVYCHSCGARLDRSTLVEEAKKPQKVVKPQRVAGANAGTLKVVKTFIKTVLFAFIAACLIQAARPPADAPSDQKEMGAEIIDAPSLSVEMEEATETPRRLGYSEGQLNAYLKNRIKAPKNPQIPAWAITYDASFVHLQTGAFRITKKYLLFTLPVYIGGTYVPTVGASGLELQPLAGHIGSLSLPGLLYDQLDQFLFADYIKNMKQEASAASKMKSIEVTPKMVVMTPGTAKR